jgi:hypothetical protein
MAVTLKEFSENYALAKSWQDYLATTGKKTVTSESYLPVYANHHRLTILIIGIMVLIGLNVLNTFKPLSSIFNLAAFPTEITPISTSAQVDALIEAQQVTPQVKTQDVDCGDIIEGHFIDNNELHIYQLEMQIRETFIIAVQPVGDQFKSKIDVLGPTDLPITNSGEALTEQPYIDSGVLSATGTYKIRIYNQVGTLSGGPGIYIIFIGCMTDEGKVVGVIPWPNIECGDVIESEFLKNDQRDIYILNMSPGESFTVSIKPVGEQVKSKIDVLGPTGLSLINSNGELEDTPSVNSGILSSHGSYRIEVYNQVGDTSGGPGIYNLYVGCMIRDGVILEPGNIPNSP